MGNGGAEAGGGICWVLPVKVQGNKPKVMRQYNTGTALYILSPFIA